MEFQQRGSPHAHILLWIDDDPKEEVSEEMPTTVASIDALCCVDGERIERAQNQTHRHTSTCYKRAKDEENKTCRFGALFWPMERTMIRDNKDREIPIILGEI
jgi:hypothetical protein